MAALSPGTWSLRLLAAATLTLYTLAESSVTSSHRDYANMYSSWALLVTPLFPALGHDHLAEGFALGVAIILIAGSGWAKVLVGGASSWCSTDTLLTILRSYGRLTIPDCGPACPALNRLLAHDGPPAAVAALATGTLVFECALVPLSLLLPSSQRWVMIVCSVGMHCGIALMQVLT
jgi:hypothetical protein